MTFNARNRVGGDLCIVLESSARVQYFKKHSKEHCKDTQGPDRSMSIPGFEAGSDYCGGWLTCKSMRRRRQSRQPATNHQYI